MPQKRINISLDEELHKRLKREVPSHKGVSGGVSGLLEDLAADYLEDVQEACLHVNNSGITEAELICIAKSLNGLLLTPEIPIGEQIAANMEDFAWLRDDVDNRGISEDQWKDVCEKVRSDESLADHLWTWKEAYMRGLRMARRLTGEIAAV